MPIRTNRGRAAVYRKLWGWPLRSPKHLAVAAFALALVVVAIGAAAPGVIGTRSAPGPRNPVAAAASAVPSGTPAPLPGSGGPTATITQTRITAPPGTPTSVPPAPQALETARKWVEKWVTHPSGITNAEWLEALRPYTTEEYLPVMRSVDPANVPASRLTGEPKAVRSFPKSVEAEVPTDGGTLKLTVIDTGAGWRVANYEQQEG
ncbi:hypothetical protein L6E12_33095 [Actinokineospora sp. PR83]|uniref:hypothetical protein n=1 Tax=Actinokineospora sp. PR83 TaxID=2884908 RepID=UPI0027E1F969|nr:hypothetical protein [Actinokineospora sp. PR83]MCG8920612.1 hypothetical protein [Actinokineospora sp. PR83]